MLILEAILNFRKARVLRRLYKHGLLEAIRPWLTLKEGEESEALIRCTLEFLLEVWITKSLICNYEFGVGKAIVKVKKSGSAENQQLADKVQKHWTSILNAKEEEPAVSAPKEPSSSVPQSYISLSQSTTSDGTRCVVRLFQTQFIEAHVLTNPLSTTTRSNTPSASNSPPICKAFPPLLPNVPKRFGRFVCAAWIVEYAALSICYEFVDEMESASSPIVRFSVHSSIHSQKSAMQYQAFRAIRLPARRSVHQNPAIRRAERQRIVCTCLFALFVAQTISTNPYFIDYVAFYAGSFSRSLGKFTRIDMPMIESLHESIRVGKEREGMRDRGK